MFYCISQNARYPHHNQNDHRIFCPQPAPQQFRPCLIDDCKMPVTFTTNKIIIVSFVLNLRPNTSGHYLIFTAKCSHLHRNQNNYTFCHQRALQPFWRCRLAPQNMFITQKKNDNRIFWRQTMCHQFRPSFITHRNIMYLY